MGFSHTHPAEQKLKAKKKKGWNFPGHVTWGGDDYIWFGDLLALFVWATEFPLILLKMSCCGLSLRMLACRLYSPYVVVGGGGAVSAKGRATVEYHPHPVCCSLWLIGKWIGDIFSFLYYALHATEEGEANCETDFQFSHGPKKICRLMMRCQGDHLLPPPPRR